MTHLYRHFDNSGKLLYIGVSFSALHRLAAHKEHSHWFKNIVRVEIEAFPSREDALRAERAAIISENPAHNIKCRRDLKAEKAAAGEAKAATRAAKAVKESEECLLSRIVEIAVCYEETHLPLPLRRGQIRKFMDKGQLGFFELPNAINTKMKRYVSGWQLIEFLEWLQGHPITSTPEH